MKARVLDEATRRGLIEPQQALAAQSRAETEGVSVWAHLIENTPVTIAELRDLVVEVGQVPWVRDLMATPADTGAIARLSRDQAVRWRVVPLEIDGDTVTVAASAAVSMDGLVRDNLRVALNGAQIRWVCAPSRQVTDKINAEYRADQALEEITAQVSRGQQAADAAPQTVELILGQAIDDKASDIHLEPGETAMTVRVRIDGVLHRRQFIPKSLAVPVVARVKVLAGMDTANSRQPQDGRLTHRHHTRQVEMRVSTLPSVWGEKVVMRILDNSSTKLDLATFGLSESNWDRWAGASQSTSGMLLATGPTGSGKSTTLYATLNHVARPEINIVTVEDPVENRIPGITQVQVNPKAGLTFASALRSILRQDPDVVLVGEIRDKETAQIAIEAAMTGHLVLSTLHTNDAPSAASRLVEMGIEPFLVGSVLRCTMAQRLARRLCVKCKVPTSKPASDLAAAGLVVPVGVEATVFEPVGCAHCAQTGYRGRIALHETVISSPEFERTVVIAESGAQIAEVALADGMVPLRHDGWAKVAQGLTTIEEVLRVSA